jgi:hypothetical protein
VQSIITASPALTHLSADLARDSFCPEAFVGVPIGTDIFVRNFVAKTCRDIIDDVEKPDAIILTLCLIIVAFCSNSIPHAEGGFGVTFNCVTKDAAFYTTTSRFVSWLGAFSQERLTSATQPPL